MGILSTIKEKLFGNSAAKTSAAATTAKAASVDVEAVIEGLIKEKQARGEKVGNWRVSIVDFLSVFGMNNSFTERKKLAAELKYNGPEYAGTAEQNTWLLKAVMKEIAESGGKVPKELIK
jgi:hypothetical protein